MKTEQISNGTRRPRNGGGQVGDTAEHLNGRDRGLDKRELLAALKQFRRGNFKVRMADDLPGIDGRVAQAFNEVVELSQRMADELGRMRQLVGVKGQIGQRASIGDV